MRLVYTRTCGWGAEALAPIPAGTLIGEYCGEVITEEEKDRRVDRQQREGDPRFYLMALGRISSLKGAPMAFVDAKAYGGFVRFLNSGCEPNCVAEVWEDASDGCPRVGIFAARDVAAGEELRYDYALASEGGAETARRYRCLCGAATCRGVMDPRADRRKGVGRRIEVVWGGDVGDGAARMFRATVMGRSEAKRGARFDLMYDDGASVERGVDLSTTAHRWLLDGAPSRPDGCPDPDADATGHAAYEEEARRYLDPRGGDGDGSGTPLPEVRGKVKAEGGGAGTPRKSPEAKDDGVALGRGRAGRAKAIAGVTGPKGGVGSKWRGEV